MSTDLYQDFRQAVDRPEDQIDLGRAALTMVRCDYPDLNVDAYLAQIDQMAVAAKERSGECASKYETIAALNYVLFQELGFRGNRDHYYDPKNSFLNEVIDRKLGIPISLSVLYIEIARRLGLSLSGVGFPGHFLVKLAGAEPDIVIDPFHGGEIRSHESLGDMLYGLYAGQMFLRSEFLEAVTKKQLLRRILNNLKVIYWKEKNLTKALSVLERLLILDPASADDMRDRGLIYLKLECFSQARADLEGYIGLKPDAEDSSEVQEQLVNLTKQLTRIH